MIGPFLIFLLVTYVCFFLMRKIDRRVFPQFRIVGPSQMLAISYFLSPLVYYFPIYRWSYYPNLTTDVYYCVFGLVSCLIIYIVGIDAPRFYWPRVKYYVPQPVPALFFGFFIFLSLIPLLFLLRELGFSYILHEGAGSYAHFTQQDYESVHYGVVRGLFGLFTEGFGGIAGVFVIVYLVAFHRQMPFWLKATLVSFFLLSYGLPLVFGNRGAFAIAIMLIGLTFFVVNGVPRLIKFWWMPLIVLSVIVINTLRRDNIFSKEVASVHDAGHKFETFSGPLFEYIDNPVTSYYAHFSIFYMGHSYGNYAKIYENQNLLSYSYGIGAIRIYSSALRLLLPETSETLTNNYNHSMDSLNDTFGIRGQWFNAVGTLIIEYGYGSGLAFLALYVVPYALFLRFHGRMGPLGVAFGVFVFYDIFYRIYIVTYSYQLSKTATLLFLLVLSVPSVQRYFGKELQPVPRIQPQVRHPALPARHLPKD